MSMREEVKEAMAAAWEKGGCRITASNVRNEHWAGVGDPAKRVALAALAVIDQYEEVEVREWQEEDGRTHMLILPNDDWFGKIGDESIGAPFTVLRRKPEPEQVTLSRETVAVLTDYVKDVPNKDMVLDIAMAEAKAVL